jgi:hypothetical protein
MSKKELQLQKPGVTWLQLYVCKEHDFNSNNDNNNNSGGGNVNETL